MNFLSAIGRIATILLVAFFSVLLGNSIAHLNGDGAIAFGSMMIVFVVIAILQAVSDV